MSTFHPFPHPPPEIRHQILALALPSTLRPALYTYNPAHYQPFSLPPTWPAYDPNPEHNIHLCYQHLLLHPTRISCPLFLVNREAREISLSWLKKHEIAIRYPRRNHDLQAEHNTPVHAKKNTEPQFLTTFNPDHDILYIPSPPPSPPFSAQTLPQGSLCHSFLTTPHLRIHEPDLLNKFISTYANPDIRHIGIDHNIFWSEEDGFVKSEELFGWHWRPEVLWVVFGGPREGDGGVGREGVGERWEVVVERRRWVWDFEEEGVFKMASRDENAGQGEEGGGIGNGNEIEGCGGIGNGNGGIESGQESRDDEGIWNVVEGMSAEVREWVKENQIKKFEIRFVEAVRP